jgi:hypothetical protein
MYYGALAMEHRRLHCVEAWIDGPRKQAALAAIHSALESLSRDPRAATVPFLCIVCGQLPVKEAPVELLHLVHNNDLPVAA